MSATRELEILSPFLKKQDRLYKYNVTSRRVQVAIVALDNQ